MPGTVVRQIDYHQVVAYLQEALDARTVTLDCDRRRLRVGGEELVLPHGEFAFYALLATAMKRGWPGAGPDGVGPDHRGWLTFEALSDPDGLAMRRFAELYDCAHRIGTATFTT